MQLKTILAVLMSVVVVGEANAATNAPYFPAPHYVFDGNALQITMQPTIMAAALISASGTGDDWAAMTGTGSGTFPVNAYAGLLVCTANCSDQYRATWVPWTGPSGATGTVTQVSVGNLAPLFTSAVATATTTPSVTYTLSNAAASTVFGNCTTVSAKPSFCAITSAMVPWGSPGQIGSVTPTTGEFTALGANQFVSTGLAPTIASAGTMTGFTIVGTNTAGTITLDTGGTPEEGDFATISFSTSLAQAPKACVMSPDNLITYRLGLYVNTPTASGFTFGDEVLPSAGVTYAWHYICI